MIKKKSLNWIIALCVAAFYLAFSAVCGAWAYSWVIWFIYAAYRFIAG